jgi:hypothetical protein
MFFRVLQAVFMAAEVAVDIIQVAALLALAVVAAMAL